MGKTKEQIAHELKNLRRDEARSAIFRYMELSTAEAWLQEELIEELELPVCSKCDNILAKEGVGDCQVCGEFYCPDCQEEHSQEETGF
jgi:hypothetical protein